MTPARRSPIVASMALVCTAGLGLLAACGSDDDTPSATIVVDDATRDDAQSLRGRHIEDGIAWAEERGIDWRLTVIGDRVIDDGTPNRDNRISFQTDGDIIVVVEWS